ncbi:VWA domain-containing protein, partial [Parabacteroides sp. OttesenSCG-928-N08]|nr:VWA domain-containing protein [Parabacteroides sp. OttesenSCG-928-N08]
MKRQEVRAAMLTISMMMLFATTLQAEVLTVFGKVVDKITQEKIVGCTIRASDSDTVVVSNHLGFYSIPVNRGSKLIFHAEGYQKQTITISGERLNVFLLIEPPVLDIVAEEEQMVVYDVAVTQHRKEMMFSMAAPRVAHFYPEGNRNEEYASFKENRFLRVADDPLSTFSIDVDVASYSNLRRHINRGELPPQDAIRTEELINYFSYAYTAPKGNDPVSISTEIGDCPWNKKHRLLRIGLKAREIPTDKLPASNLVFLIDVSGSMYGATRLELVKSSLKLLVNNLREEDRVAIVVYSGSAGEVLPSTSGGDKQKIREALDQLTAGGSTAGGEGIRLAYKIARNSFVANGNNRVILCTDGDFNVGISSPQGLEQLIEKERKSGIFLTVLGYGMGNYKDNRMQVLAEKGNGNHAYIDNLQEANKVLVQEFGSTIHTVAKDVKLQLEFNPAQVQAYRLIGYESRLLNDEDFNDDSKDAGEMGAGHTVTALYEIVPTGVESNLGGGVDPLKYQQQPTVKFSLPASEELLTVKLRYKAPDSDVSQRMEVVVSDNRTKSLSSDFRFAAAVAMFGQLLRDSDFKGDGDCDKVIALAQSALDNDGRGYRREFIRLVESARGMLGDRE